MTLFRYMGRLSNSDFKSKNCHCSSLNILSVLFRKGHQILCYIAHWSILLIILLSQVCGPGQPQQASNQNLQKSTTFFKEIVIHGMVCDVSGRAEESGSWQMFWQHGLPCVIPIAKYIFTSGHNVYILWRFIWDVTKETHWNSFSKSPTIKQMTLTLEFKDGKRYLLPASTKVPFVHWFVSSEQGMEKLSECRPWSSLWQAWVLITPILLITTWLHNFFLGRL